MKRTFTLQLWYGADRTCKTPLYTHKNILNHIYTLTLESNIGQYDVRAPTPLRYANLDITRYTHFLSSWY